jgi:beta-lactam-binding protein with PASTA domain
MSLINYLKSRVFIAQVLSVIVIVAVLSFLFFHWLTFVTHHGEEITVPNLTKLTPEQAEELLDELDLDYEIIDTVDYQPTIPKLAIVQQEPTAGSKVKGGRTIYIKLNAPTYKMVSVPDLIDRTYRQAVPNLKAVGLLEGSKRYLP